MNTIFKLSFLTAIVIGLASCKKDEPRDGVARPIYTVAGHECVDMGLSVKWATCNIGAECETDYGSYYAWGETDEWEKSREYSMGEYDKNAEPDYGMTKYNITDGLTTLEMNDDVVQWSWRDSWRIPTKDEIKELVEGCDWKWTSMKDKNGKDVYGYIVSSRRTTGYIFLPAAGRKTTKGLEFDGETGFYWSSSTYRISDPKFKNMIPYLATNLNFDSESLYCTQKGADRKFGFTIRGVINFTLPER